jgi:hypothetical protein
MPNIIRIRNLENETNLNNAIIPVDKDSYHTLAKKITGEDLKDWVLSGYTCVEDIHFYFSDISSGVVQQFYIDPFASYDYRILSVVLVSNSSLTGIHIRINGLSVVWTGSATSVTSTTTVISTDSISANEVSTYKNVTLETSGSATSATKITGKLKIIRLKPCNALTTTTTTAYPYYYLGGNEPIGLGNLL